MGRHNERGRGRTKVKSEIGHANDSLHVLKREPVSPLNSFPVPFFSKPGPSVIHHIRNFVSKRQIKTIYEKTKSHSSTGFSRNNRIKVQS